jgi:hypothetical protein
MVSSDRKYWPKLLSVAENLGQADLAAYIRHRRGRTYLGIFELQYYLTTYLSATTGPEKVVPDIASLPTDMGELLRYLCKIADCSSR